MREIKFRAWNVEEKKMYRVEAIDWSESTIVTCHLYDDKQTRKFYPNKEFGDNIEFMQYTGLKDKKGIEIYEGDIVKTDIDESISDIEFGEVIMEWGNWSIRNENSQDKTCGLDSYTWVGDGSSKRRDPNLEVIGNIYENPEFLGSK